MTHSFPTRRSSDLSRCRGSASGERASGCGRVPVIEQGRISGAGNLGRARTAWNDLRAEHGGGESAAGFVTREQLTRSWRWPFRLPKHLASRTRASWIRSEEHTSELQSLMRISYAVFCLKKKIPN